MAAVAKSRTIGAEFRNEEQVVRVIYDSTVDGLVQGALDLFTAQKDVIITGFHSYVKVAATSGGSATLIVGITSDTDAFMTLAQGAVANLTLGAMIKPPAVEGTPNLLPLPLKLAAGAKVLQTIGTADLLTGQVEYVLKYVQA